MLKGERKWAAWMTIIQTMVLKRAYDESLALLILANALNVETDEKISGDPDKLTRQAEEFVKWAARPDPSTYPMWLKESAE